MLSQNPKEMELDGPKVRRNGAFLCETQKEGDLLGQYTGCRGLAVPVLSRKRASWTLTPKEGGMLGQNPEERGCVGPQIKRKGSCWTWLVARVRFRITVSVRV